VVSAEPGEVGCEHAGAAGEEGADPEPVRVGTAEPVHTDDRGTDAAEISEVNRSVEIDRSRYHHWT
jgi:hypothetical protein